MIDTMRVGGKNVIVKEHHDDYLKNIIVCPNCGQETEYGKTRMVSGFVGCDNYLGISNDECYFGDLLPRVLKVREQDYGRYVKGERIYLVDIERGE